MNKSLFNVVSIEEKSSNTIRLKNATHRREKFTPPKSGLYYLYHLRLRGKYHYIGVTRNWKERLKTHYEGFGSKLTKKYRVVKVLGVWELGIMSYSEAQEIEDAYTLETMEKYTNQNVRGGRFLDEFLDEKSILKSNLIEHGVLSKYEFVEPWNEWKKIKRKVKAREETKDFREKKSPYKKGSRKMAKRLGLFSMSYEESIEKLFEFWQTMGIEAGGYEEAAEVVFRKGWHRRTVKF